MIVIYTVVSSLAQAEKLGKLLLERHLCACVNMIPNMKSMYWWDGNIESSDETILLIKTEKEKYAAVERLIKENHSYEVPAIFSFEAEQVEPTYGTWLKNQIK